MSRIAFLIALVVRASAALAAPPVPYAPIRGPDADNPPVEIEMFVGESRVFPAPGVARIAVGNGALLSATALDKKEVILFANGAGASSLFIWNADGRHQRVTITIVPGDTARHAREIAAFVSTIPKARASVVGTHIIVEGDELSDADIAKVEELAKRYPQIVNFTNRIGWEQMVMLDVKVVEFPVTVLRDIGLKWSSTGGAAIAGIWSPARRGREGPYEVAIRTDRHVGSIRLDRLGQHAHGTEPGGRRLAHQHAPAHRRRIFPHDDRAPARQRQPPQVAIAQHERDESERNIDPENPVPGQVIDKEPAEHRPEHHRDRHDARQISLIQPAFARRNDIGDRRLGHRAQAAPAKPLHYPRGDQLRHRLRQRA